jgi:putative transposase
VRTRTVRYAGGVDQRQIAGVIVGFQRGERRVQAEKTIQVKKGGGDISYLWTDEGWLYLAVVIDLYSRRVVGWATAERVTADLVCAALTMACGAGICRKASSCTVTVAASIVRRTICH